MLKRAYRAGLVLSLCLTATACESRHVATVTDGALRVADGTARFTGLIEEAPRLAAVFCDHAVLQRHRAVPVWGTARPGHRVVVEFANQKLATVAGDEGRWIVRFDPMHAGGPYELKVSSGMGKVERKDIMIGEVWVCSGQSNMAWPLSAVNEAQREVRDAVRPNIRLFTVPRRLALGPSDDVEGHWSPCSPQTARGFSAVGYFFGRELYRRLGVPIGLINASWGGSRAEPWTPRRFLNDMPELADTLAGMDKQVEQYHRGRDEAMREFHQATKDYNLTLQKYMGEVMKKDAGSKGGWQQVGLDTAGWETMKLPALWEDTKVGNFDGIIWFRREVDIPEPWAGQDLLLELGPVDDDDVTFFNGVQIGAMGYGRQNHWMTPRSYPVPSSLVKAGKATIVCRVLDGGGGGGFGGEPGQMRLSLANAPARTMPLAGEWLYKVGFGEAGFRVPGPPRRPSLPRGVGSMYNGMIAPIQPYAIAGAIWYQGESNAGRPIEYRTLFPRMIRSWRETWGQDDFPFLFVQLANFTPAPAEPDEGGWAWLREAQTMALATPNTGMAVTIDIGEAGDIHPRNKQDVGKRLALAAMVKAYGRTTLVHSGPMYESMKIDGGTVRLKFRHVGEGLEAKGGPLKRFAIAGEDGKFVWADAEIAPPAGEDKPADTVIVRAASVAKPAAVRYAWSSNPAGCNLYNKDGLPASPFRTDDWPRPKPAGP